MSSRLFRRAATYAGLWGGVTFFAVLLTMVFSFLGTVICSVLAGMMMGATKPSRWLSIPISLLFPAILAGVLHFTKAELLPRQIVLISLLCFGSFWGLYAGAAWVMACESKQPPADQATLASTQKVAPDAKGSSAPPQRLVSLIELQGKWLCEDQLNGNPRKRLLEIKENKLSLSAIDSNGRAVRAAEAAFTLITHP